MADSSTLRDGNTELQVGKDDMTVDVATTQNLASSVDHYYPLGWKLAVVIFPLCLGTLLVAIDNTIIAVAIPEIATTFKSLGDVGWYGSAYLLTVTVLQPIFGKIYTYFDMKRTYLGSVVVFEAGSILCAAAPNSRAFILGRAIAGMGAAGLFQGALSIVMLSVSLQRRPLFLGIVASSFGIATCFGPILGGVFTSDLSWRWCFWINVPIGVVDLLLILIFLKLRDVEKDDRSLTWRSKIRQMDLGGAFTLIAAVCCLLLALQWGGNTYPWVSSKIIGLFVGFGLLLGVFCVLQWKFKDKATIPPHFLRQRSVLMGCCYTFLLSISNYTAGYYLPFYFQAVDNVSATRSGIDFIAFALPQMFAILLAGAIANRTGHYVELMIIGAIIGSIGAGLLTRLGLTSKAVVWAAYMIVTGLGIGLGTNLPYTALQAVLSEHDIPIGNALTIFFQQLGGAIAIPVANALFVNGLVKEISKQTNAVSPQNVIDAGPTKLTILAPDPEVLRALKLSYLQAVKNSLYLAVAAVVVAVPFAIGMEWRTLNNSTQEGERLGTPQDEEMRKMDT